MNAAARPSRLLALLVVLAAADARGLVSVPCDSSASFDPDGPEPPVFDSTTAEGSCSSALAVGPVSLGSSGEAGVGSFLARSDYVRLGEEPIDDASTFARAQFRDTIVLDSPGLAGQLVTIHATAFLNGVIDVTGTGEAAVRLGLVVSPGGSSTLVFEECRVGQACFGSFDPYPRIVSAMVDVSLQVQVGASVTFGLSLTTSAGHGGSLVDLPGSGLAEFGAAGGVGWGGITDVRHGDSPVPFTITSESGTDWTQPVPEPDGSALAMLAIALLRRRSPR